MIKLITNLKKSWKKLDKYTKWAFYIILIAVLIRFSIASINYITGDACGYINVIRFMAENFKIPLYEPLGRPPLWQPPLFFIIATFFYKAFSLISIPSAEFSIKLLSPIASILIITYTFLLIRKLFNSKIAFYAILFLSFIPDFIYHSTMPFVDITVALFILTSIYYILKNKIIISSILMACALSTKYNALFALPIPVILLYLNYSKNIKLFLKKSVTFCLVSGLIGSLWYIRNWILLGSPIWPHFTEAISTGSGISFLNLINPYAYLRLYLSFFGVPDGYYQNLFFIKFPFISLMIAVWVIGTIIFLLPLLRGIPLINIKQKKYKILIVWLIPYLLFLLLTFTGGSLSSATELFSKDVPETILARYLIPIFPVFSVIWAIGFVKLKKIKTMYLFLFILVISGFSGIEFIKSEIVSNSWSFYEEDFNFIKNNAPKDAKILVPFGPCYGYNFNRYTEDYSQNLYDINQLIEQGISYIWVNQYNNLYGFGPGDYAIYPAVFYKEIKNEHSLIYYNDKTKTEIYKVKYTNP